MPVERLVDGRASGGLRGVEPADHGVASGAWMAARRALSGGWANRDHRRLYDGGQTSAASHRVEACAGGRMPRRSADHRMRAPTRTTAVYAYTEYCSHHAIARFCNLKRLRTRSIRSLAHCSTVSTM